MVYLSHLIAVNDIRVLLSDGFASMFTATYCTICYVHKQHKYSTSVKRLVIHSIVSLSVAVESSDVPECQKPLNGGGKVVVVVGDEEVIW